jgi:hypothetical protein
MQTGTSGVGGGSTGAASLSGAGAPGLQTSVVAVQGGLAASATQIDLGPVEMGKPATRFDWEITSLGSSPVEGLRLTSTSADDIAVADGCGARIEAGAHCTIGLTYTPHMAGTLGAKVTLGNTGGVQLDLSLSVESELRVTLVKTGNGRVISTPVGLDCGGTCSALFESGTVLQFEIQADPGSVFEGLDGAACSPGESCTLAVTASTELGLRFARANNVVFVSSESFSPTLGGVAAYDAECNRLATAAGLNTPSGDGYIAALSASTSSFTSRLRPGVRGWARMDGKPFADTVQELLSGVIYHPIMFDEHGSAQLWRMLTGTQPDGSVGDNCSDWSDPTGSVVTGYATGGTEWWIDAAPSMPCDTPLPIFCLGNTNTAPLVLPTATGKRIWHTNTAYIPGSMSPDEKCALEKPNGVSAARALVAYADRPASSVLDLASNYVRPDGQLVGTGQQLINGGNDTLWGSVPSLGAVIQTGLWQAADGSYGPGGNIFLVWNGARDLISVGAAADNCDNWTATTDTGLAGIFAQAQEQFWQRGGPDNCSASAFLYCVEP